MTQFEDLIAEEARKIVEVGTDIAEFDGFDDTFDAFEDEMRRTFEERLLVISPKYPRAVSYN